MHRPCKKDNLMKSVSRKKARKLLCIIIVLLISGSSVCFLSCNEQKEPVFPSYKEYRKQEFDRLAAIREDKAQKLRQWLSGKQSLLESRETNSRLTEFFEKFEKELSGGVDRKRFLELNREIEHFFVYELGAFYDLLFIDADEKVFYSVKMEDDFQSSLKTGPYAETRLAEIIRKSPEKTEFVDFQYYGASDEPAAFYVLPVRKDGRYKGAIALQLSINHLNQLLTDRTGLGKTGEAYLVNNQHLMLTESRFIGDSTVLSKKIDTSAVKKMSGESGRKVITDYRDEEVLSTFCGFPVGRTNWRIIVEKDENEVITDYYRKYSSELYPLMADAVQRQTAGKKKAAENELSPGREAKRVDVSELVKADNRKELFTPGLATCTGVVVHGDSDEFAYMAHLSPTDKSYGAPGNQDGDFRSKDLVSLMLRRIQYFEIKPCQLGELRFMIAATHTRSIRRIIEKLTQEGILLSQIKAGILEDASSASLFYQTTDNRLVSIWHTDDEKHSYRVDFDELTNLGTLTRKLTKN